MEKIDNKHYTGERALFKSRDLEIDKCLFDDGESPLKESKNLIITNTTFGYKYPLWYGDNHQVSNCKFLEMSRSGIWYNNHSTFKDLEIIAPKLFRRCDSISLENINFYDAKETLWTCSNISLKNIKIENGDYFGKDSSNIYADNITINGNYCFDGGKNIKVSNSILNSKDAFWNCENVTIKNSTIVGEYLGWNTKNLTLINCQIKSHQGFCYIENLIIKNSTITDSDLIFEYCKNIDVDVNSTLDTVKNPISGIIRSYGIKDYIKDDNDIDHSKVKLINKVNEDE